MANGAGRGACVRRGAASPAAGSRGGDGTPSAASNLGRALALQLALVRAMLHCMTQQSINPDHNISQPEPAAHHRAQTAAEATRPPCGNAICKNKTSGSVQQTIAI